MNVKNILVAGLVGGIVNWILGFLLWGLAFASVFPEDPNMNMAFITLGCLTFGYLLAYVLINWANITNPMSGAKAGAVLSLMIGLHANFFYHSNDVAPDMQLMGLDILLTVFCGAIVGAVIAMVNGKLK